MGYRPPIPVVVTSAGTASAISVIKALKKQSVISVDILAVDADSTAAGLFIANRYELVPPCSDPKYFDYLFELTDKYSSKVVFPIYSKEIEHFSKNLNLLESRGIKTLLSNAKTIQLANDKLRMCSFVADLGIPAPEFISKNNEWPGVLLVGKKNQSSGSDGLCRISDKASWDYFRKQDQELIFQIFVSGKEFTVDVLCDRNSECLVCSARERISVKAGQSVKGRTQKVSELEEMVRVVCKKAEIVGPANLQFIYDGHQWNFIELNPRFAAGGLMLTVEAGANIPLMMLQLILDEEITPVSVRENVTMIRFWEEIFI